MARELTVLGLAPEARPHTKKEIDQSIEPVITITEHQYQLSDLARMDEKQNLGLKLLKPRNPTAARGSQFDILKINKTNLVVRREWVSKSQLLVIIPEKLIYKIFNEQTGECVYDAGKQFMDSLREGFFDDQGRLQGPANGYRELTEEEATYVGQTKNETSLEQFFKNLNRCTIVKDITNSELLWGKNLFVRYRDHYDNEAGRYVGQYRFTGLPFAIGTLRLRQLACLYYKSPKVLINNEQNRWDLYPHLTLDQMKISMKLVLEFPDRIPHLEILERLWDDRTWWPDNTVITDINILRRIFKSIEEPEYRWSRNAGDELRAAIYQYAWGINEWDKYKAYLQEFEYYNLNKIHYFDIMKQAKMLNNGKLKDKYPAFWLSFEQKVKSLYIKHEKFIKAQRTFEYSETLEKLEHITAVDNKDYDYQIMLPRTYGDILAEGEKMNHCVAGYADQVYSGSKVVLFLRKKSRPDKPLGTVEVVWQDKDDLKTFTINQCKGQSNTRLPIEVLAYVKKYIELKKLKGVTEHYVKTAIEDGSIDQWEEQQRIAKEEAAKAKAEAKAQPVT